METVLLARNCRMTLSILLFLYLLIGCNFKREVQGENISALENQDRGWLLGKTINSIDSIVHSDSGYRIFYVFNYYDCNTCINTGFQLVNKIDSLCNRSCVKVVTSMVSNLAPIQRANNYRGYIYTDMKDLIRRELKYSPTPMLILVNLDNKIVDALIPTDNPNSLQCRRFLNSCIKYFE